MSQPTTCADTIHDALRLLCPHNQPGSYEDLEILDMLECSASGLHIWLHLAEETCILESNVVEDITLAISAVSHQSVTFHWSCTKLSTCTRPCSCRLDG